MNIRTHDGPIGRGLPAGPRRGRFCFLAKWRVRRRLFDSACLISLVLLVVAMASRAAPFKAPAIERGVSISESFRIGYEPSPSAPAMGRLLFFNRPEGPYRGSVVYFTDEDGNPLVPMRVVSFGEVLGVYFRYFHWMESGDTLWTLTLSVAYPIAMLSVLPVVWLYRRLGWLAFLPTFTVAVVVGYCQIHVSRWGHVAESGHFSEAFSCGWPLKYLRGRLGSDVHVVWPALMFDVALWLAIVGCVAWLSRQAVAHRFRFRLSALFVAQGACALLFGLALANRNAVSPSCEPWYFQGPIAVGMCCLIFSAGLCAIHCADYLRRRVLRKSR